MASAQDLARYIARAQMQHAFEGRPGHGGGQLTKRSLTRHELEVLFYKVALSAMIELRKLDRSEERK